mgnify:CR=1 FL=1
MTVGRLPWLKLAVLVAVLGLVVMCTGLGLAQESESAATTVTVTGTGRVSREATRATVDTVIEGTGDTPAEAEEAVRRQYAAIQHAVNELGFELVPGQFSLNPRWEYRDGASVQSGYEARRFVQIVISDAARTGEAIQGLLNAGLSFVYNVTYAVDDRTAARDEAIRLALEDARQQAEAVARYMGMRLGRVLTITGSDAWPGYYEGVDAGGVQMDPAPVSVQVSLKVTYELLEPKLEPKLEP